MHWLLLHVVPVGHTRPMPPQLELSARVLTQAPERPQEPEYPPSTSQGMGWVMPAQLVTTLGMQPAL